ncbi:hypothetical protein SC09_contig8orf00101 [Bacillus subtilis]|uniref:Uncharacterized protein n=1 Tax=Bacillus subtilis TaxID=1423 RepID=A0A0D1KMP1_BACIU|nr:hypothetical protein SC09_contig8orf00101 [Bacillus subtilis]
MSRFSNKRHKTTLFSLENQWLKCLIYKCFKAFKKTGNSFQKKSGK